MILKRLNTLIRSVVVGVLAMIVGMYSSSFAQINTHTLTRADGKGGVIAQEPLRPFFHGVASGDPLADRVILWTRVTPDIGTTPSEIRVQWRIATDTALTNVVQRGEIITTPQRDYTVKIDIAGLQAGTTYYYGFTALGANSLTGRTRTAVQSATAHLRFAVASCSNFAQGFFNAYARIADRNDLDAVIHLGDYIYEYGANTNNRQDARAHAPTTEIVTLADYRARYSQHRLDTDLRRLHQQQAFICVWDDHEFTNDAYRDSAQNHQANEGLWTIRRSASKRAYYEWMPIRENADSTIYRSFVYGGLAEIMMIDSRIEGREIIARNFANDSALINNPNRSMLGTAQLSWLQNRLRTSQARWKIIGNQVIFAPVQTRPLLTINPLYAVLQDGFLDSWNGYPAERRRIVETLRQNNVQNTVILTGDFHTSFAFDIPVNDDLSGYDSTNARSSIAVEFVTPSITSGNFDDNAGITSLLGPTFLTTLINDVARVNPINKAADLTNHGYFVLDVLPERVQADFFFVDSVRIPWNNESRWRSFTAQNNVSLIRSSATPAPLKSRQEIPAPALPPRIVSSVQQQPVFTVLSVYPTPASDIVFLHGTLPAQQTVRIAVVDMQGHTLQEQSMMAQRGSMTVSIAVRSLPAGAYRIEIRTEKGNVSVPCMVVR